MVVSQSSIPISTGEGGMNSVRKRIKRYVEKDDIDDGTLNKRKRVLLVGVGGVGCEVLKCLVHSGFRSIEIVDMDTIELTNLNRQLLYRQKDIKRPKAQVALEAVTKFGLDLAEGDIIAHCEDIRSTKFNTTWFMTFDCVIGTLDNLKSRKHLNSLCLASGVPLIESGTEGHKGQITVHLKGKTRCYSCDPAPPARKTYATCTIRSKPTEPIHCVVWAREYLFESLFGIEISEYEERLKEIKKITDSEIYFKEVFNKVFVEDIELSKLVSGGKLKHVSLQDLVLKKPENVYDPKTVWTLEENIYVFRDKLLKLRSENKTNEGLSFEKDDDTMLHFVTSASNIRSYIFNIKMENPFSVKNMAANVIPAVSTTNAIVAGIIIIQLLAVLNSSCGYSPKNAWVSPGGVVPEIPLAPKEDCPDCSALYFTLKSNHNLLSLETALITTLKMYLKLKPNSSIHKNNITTHETPPPTLESLLEDISVTQGPRLLYDIDFKSNMDASLSSLNLESGSRLHIYISQADVIVLELIDTLQYVSSTSFDFFISSNPTGLDEGEKNSPQHLIKKMR